MSNQVEAILFDFGGTLDYDGIDWFTRFYEYVAGYAGGLEAEKLSFFLTMKQSAVEMTDMPDIMQLNIDQTVVRWMENTHRILLESSAEAESLVVWAEKWDPYQIASEFMADSHEYIKRNFDILAKLRDEYRLGCISNNWGNIEGWCQQVNYDGFFEVMIDSALENSVKPDPVIFQAAIERMGLDPSRTVYVGDRYDADVLGASGVGMIPLWLTGGKEVIESNIVYMDHGLRQSPYSVRPSMIRSLSDVFQISELL